MSRAPGFGTTGAACCAQEASGATSAIATSTSTIATARAASASAQRWTHDDASLPPELGHRPVAIREVEEAILRQELLVLEIALLGAQPLHRVEHGHVHVEIRVENMGARAPDHVSLGAGILHHQVDVALLLPAVVERQIARGLEVGDHHLVG